MEKKQINKKTKKYRPDLLKKTKKYKEHMMTNLLQTI